MITIPNYQIIEQIYESASSRIYRGLRSQDNQAVILKILKNDYPSLLELIRYQQEYDITRNLNVAGVIKAYALEKSENLQALILEDFGGQSLKQWVSDLGFGIWDLGLINKQVATNRPFQPTDISAFLSLAIEVVDILGDIHAAHLIHKDINPSNIVWNPKTHQLKIIDFGISTQLSRENPTLKNPEVLEGTLSYLSPEQTGRMNRTLDYRSDFYSLGVTFYELLTGHLPFESEEPLELVHCHIAKPPTSVHEGNPIVPLMISDIIMKLMAKNVEDRYQSALGLKTDLEKCLNLLQDSKSLDEPVFELGKNDFSGQFQIPQKLYGRDEAIATLLQAFNRVANPQGSPDSNEGKAEMMLVAGYSGVGKSVLVREVHKPMTEKQGYFAFGKFDQYQHTIPYSAFSQAFNEFCHYLLSENQEHLAHWRECILDAVGNNGQVLIDIIPALALVIGPQPAVPPVGPTEAQNRFMWVFQNFVKAISQKEHPLVMFIDDWQWADSGSLNALKMLLSDPDLQYFLLIGAYRDNEVDASHPFVMTLEALEKQQAILNTLKLDNLSYQESNTLIADALHCDRASVVSLTNMVYEKTLGNAFFTTEFLKALYEEELLSFDFDSQSWYWDLDKIRLKGMSNNVVELMVGKIQKCLPQTQTVLKLAACIGSQFDLQMLSVIHKHTANSTLEDLWQAVTEGLLIPLDEHYKLVKAENSSQAEKSRFKFQHDRIQQAAYALIAKTDRTALHLEIGRLLLNNTQTEELPERIFDIVNQLNGGRTLITDETENVRLADLNLQAGKKAKAGTAYQTAINYLELGLSLLGNLPWEQYYATTFELHKEQGECAFLLGNFQASDQLLALALEKAASKFHKADIYVIKFAQLAVQGKYHDAVATMIEALNMFDMKVPTLEQTELQEQATAAEMALYNDNMKERQIVDLWHLPPMQNEGMKVCSRLIAIAIDSLIISFPERLVFYTAKMVNISIEYGLSAFIPTGYAIFATILSGGFKDYGNAYQFAALALELNQEKLPNYAAKPTISNAYSFFNMLRKHINVSAEYFRETYRISLECGDFACAAYAMIEVPRYLLPVSVEEGLKTTQEAIAYCEKANNIPMLLVAQMYAAFIKNLQGETLSQNTFNHSDFKEEAFINAFEKIAPVLFALYKRYKLQSLTLFNSYDQALPLVHERAAWIAAFGGVDLSLRSDYFLYAGVTIAALYPTVSDAEKADYMAILDECIDENRLLFEQCPINFEHPYMILQAEKARIEDKPMLAMQYYDQAISSAKEQSYRCNEALANELAAQFWLAQEKEEFARIYFKGAHYAYELWGATAKVKDLEEKYPKFLNAFSQISQLPEPSSTLMTRGFSTRIATSSNMLLDFGSVLKASQAIAGEIELQKLFKQLMTVIIENAGAQRGVLILDKRGEWVIEAEGAIDDEEVKMLESLAINQSVVPTTLINYVANAKTSMVLHDATHEGQFTQEPYFKDNQTQSALCAPLLNKAQLIGLLYLENNLTVGAFTQERLNVLKVLSSQAVISLENASLYRTLEEKVEERTAQLAQANLEITELNKQLKDENLRMSAELDISRELQQMLLPKEEELQKIENLEIAGFLEPADEVGGDYYDILNRHGRILIGVGDVTGHGLESGVLAIMTQTAVRTLLANHETDPVKFLSAINEAIYDNVQRMNSDKNLTLILLEYQSQAAGGGLLRLSGQHEDPIMVRNGKVEQIDTMELGFNVGMIEEISDFINQIEIDLNPGDVVVLYTDGITEAENENKEEYGIERLTQVIEANWQASVSELRQAIVNDMQAFISPEKPDDDITLLVLKQK
jgi:predicted ATPase/serine phosphatase RsbU (regulator of sigma subunit)/tRNA A-37 threonylcarbamoyl transferase component Bud32